MTSDMMIKAQALVIAEAIQTLKEVPSGHLFAYATAYMSFDAYERIIALLVASNLIERRGHVLRWIGAKES